MGFSETNLRKKQPISQEFCRKIRDKFRRKTILKIKPTSQKFSEEISLEERLVSRTFLMKENGNFLFLQGGGAG